MKKSALLTACAVLTAVSLALYGCGYISGMGSNSTENGGSSGGNNNGTGGDNSGGSGGGTDNPGNGGTDNPGNGGDNNGGSGGGNNGSGNGGSGGETGGNNGGSGGSTNTEFSENMTGTGNPADYFKATLLQTVPNADGTTAYYYVLNKDSTLTIPETTVSEKLGMAEGFKTETLSDSNIVYYEGGFNNPRGLFTALSGSFSGGTAFGGLLLQANIPTADGTIQNIRWSVKQDSPTKGFFGPVYKPVYADKLLYGTFTRALSPNTASLRYESANVSLIRYRYPKMESGLETKLFADFIKDYSFSFESLWNAGESGPFDYQNVYAKMIPVVVTAVKADGSWTSHLERIFPPFF